MITIVGRMPHPEVAHVKRHPIYIYARTAATPTFRFSKAAAGEITRRYRSRVQRRRYAPGDLEHVAHDGRYMISIGW